MVGIQFIVTLKKEEIRGDERERQRAQPNQSLHTFMRPMLSNVM